MTFKEVKENIKNHPERWQKTARLYENNTDYIAIVFEVYISRGERLRLIKSFWTRTDTCIKPNFFQRRQLRKLLKNIEQ